MSQFCILSLCCLHSVTTLLYSLVRRNLKPESTIPQFSWLCMLAIPGTDTSSCTLWLSPSKLYSLPEYLVLDDEGCINALLRVDFIPSTSDHLFWDRNIESFFSALRLAVISGRFSRRRKFWEYINVPWSMHPLKCSTSTHLFTVFSLHSSTLIPIFIISGWSHVY